MSPGDVTPAPVTVKANPYAWPWNGDLRPANTALVVIDMQTDFCGIGAMSTAWVTTSA